jgi:putative cell wall-binding protein/uncharacterized protein (DUF2141 family)
MFFRSRRPRLRAAAASLFAATLGVAGLGLATSPAGATAEFDLTRLAGDDRVETAVDIATSTFPAGTTANALIARDDLFPDALAGNYLAGVEEAPTLLSHNNDVPAETIAALDTLGVTDVTLLGGVNALDESVEAELEGEGFAVTREAGADRYETAAAIATQPGVTVGTTANGRTAILATGEDFPDALAAGPLSYAERFPVLLTPGDALGENAEAAFAELDIEHVLITGGPDAVSGTIEAELTAQGITSERIAGPTRYTTAVEIAEYATARLGFVETGVDVATGRDFPDALTGGPHAGENLVPILLANEANTEAACAYLTSIADTVTDGHIFGGIAAVSTAVEETLEDCGGASDAATNQTFDVAPAEDQTVGVGSEVSHTASGITSDTVDVALFACDDVTTAQDGTVTFADADNDGHADITPTDAVIAQLNGEPGTYGDHQSDVVVTDGSITFTVTSNSEECVVGVVFDDADNDDGLAVNAAGEPTEAFGVSGELTFAAAAATQLDLEPQQETNLVATDHTLTATVVDQFGDPVDETVRFEVYRDVEGTQAGEGESAPAPAEAQDVTTGEDGVVSLTYTGPAEEADDIIVACVLESGETTCDTTFTTQPNDVGLLVFTVAEGDPQVGQDPSDAAEKYWVEQAPAGEFEGDVLGFDIVADNVDLETEADVAVTDEQGVPVVIPAGTNLRFVYDADDLFFIVGADGQPVAVSMEEFEAALDENDVVEVSYLPDGVSEFTLTNVTV